MKKAMKRYLLWLYALVVGIASGLLLGLFVVGTLIRVVFDLIFGYGDSGPQWVTWSIVVLTLIILIFCIRISFVWMKGYMNRKGMGGQ